MHGGSLCHLHVPGYFAMQASLRMKLEMTRQIIFAIASDTKQAGFKKLSSNRRMLVCRANLEHLSTRQASSNLGNYELAKAYPSGIQICFDDVCALCAHIHMPIDDDMISDMIETMCMHAAPPAAATHCAAAADDHELRVSYM